MRKAIQAGLPVALAAVVGLALAPSGLRAQEKAKESADQQACTAKVTPAAVEPGQKAVEVVAALSQDVGPIAQLKAEKGSGVALAQTADLPKSQQKMARSEKGNEPAAIEMSKEANSATLWLSTVDATPGEHAVELQGQDGTCTARITVKKPEKQKKEQ